MDTTVFEKRNSNGQVIEKWGNYFFDDRNGNFRDFFFYDEKGLLIKEKNYAFDEDNIACNIIDSAEYNEIFYDYTFDTANGFILSKKTCYQCNYDKSGKFIGRKLNYIYDEIKKLYTFREDRLGN